MMDDVTETVAVTEDVAVAVFVAVAVIEAVAACVGVCVSVRGLDDGEAVGVCVALGGHCPTIQRRRTALLKRSGRGAIVCRGLGHCATRAHHRPHPRRRASGFPGR